MTITSKVTKLVNGFKTCNEQLDLGWDLDQYFAWLENSKGQHIEEEVKNTVRELVE